MKNLTNNQKIDFLNKYLHDINVVVSSKLGIKTNLEIKEKEIRGTTYHSLKDTRNMISECGIMAAMCTEVYIESSQIFWNEDNVAFRMEFSYKHVGGGSNGHEFCVVIIKNDIVQIR